MNDEARMTNDERSSKLEIRSSNSDFGLRFWTFFVIRHSCFVIPPPLSTLNLEPRHVYSQIHRRD